MTGEIVLLLVASAAATVSVVSARRGIARHRLATGRGGGTGRARRRQLGERVDAVYRSLEVALDATPPAAASARAGALPADADVAVAFLRRHLIAADEDEVQRLLPMLQLLEQRALERAAALHPRVTR